jgi:hypothetical protein
VRGHLAWGYVDIPPLAAAQAWFARSALGGSQFASVEPVAEVGNDDAMASRRRTPYLCRRPRGWTLAAVWPRLKP